MIKHFVEKLKSSIHDYFYNYSGTFSLAEDILMAFAVLIMAGIYQFAAGGDTRVAVSASPAFIGSLGLPSEWKALLESLIMNLDKWFALGLLALLGCLWVGISFRNGFVRRIGFLAFGAGCVALPFLAGSSYPVLAAFIRFVFITPLTVPVGWIESTFGVSDAAAASGVFFAFWLVALAGFLVRWIFDYNARQKVLPKKLQIKQNEENAEDIVQNEPKMM